MHDKILTLETMRQLFISQGQPSTASKSRLAGSLLLVPNIFPESVGVLIWTYAMFDIDLGTDVSDVINEMADLPRGDLFLHLAGEDASAESRLPRETLDALTMLDLAVESPELAASMDPSGSFAVTLLQQLNVREVTELVTAELRNAAEQITPGKLLLSQVSVIGSALCRLFPELGAHLNELVSLVPEPPARHTRTRETRELLAIDSQMDSIEAFEALYDDPDSLAQLALHRPALVDNAKLYTLLNDAHPRVAAHWLMGVEGNRPAPGQIAEFATTMTDDRIREVGAEFKHLMGQEFDPSELAWLPEIIEHLFVVDTTLNPAIAAIVWYTLNQRFNDDAATWAAFCGLLASSDEAVRIEDL